MRVTSNGLEKQPGIFISRLVPGGLAESTGLLAVNDEVLEVNGIEVAGKTLDQVCLTLTLTCFRKYFVQIEYIYDVEQSLLSKFILAGYWVANWVERIFLYVGNRVCSLRLWLCCYYINLSQTLLLSLSKFKVI